MVTGLLMVIGDGQDGEAVVVDGYWVVMEARASWSEWLSLVPLKPGGAMEVVGE